ncbi:metal ABC transporter permease [Rhodococcus hoagii]|nr:metal ABC transporter permease [Prescottella equi]
MITGFIGPNAGATVIQAIYQAFQQGATIGNAVDDGNWGNLMATFGVVDWGSTFTNLGPGVLPLVF